MKLFARKPCSFAGKKFFIGDEIPAELVLNPQAQEKRGILAIVADGSVEAPAAGHEVVHDKVETMAVVIRAEEGDMPLELTQAGLQAMVDVLTSKVEDAEPIIAAMTDGDALILLHLTDSRKSVKNAAEARAKALNENLEESAGDQ